MSESYKYYHLFIDRLVDHIFSCPTLDYGLLTEYGRGKAYKANQCLFLTGGKYPCGVCEVCRGMQVKEQLKSIRPKMFSPSVHSYYSIHLSLPKWVGQLPVVGGCKSFGELFFVTPTLFHHGQVVPMNEVLSDFRKVGVAAVQGIFPKMKLGMFFGMHLVNDWMVFSPHLHVILCGTGLAEEYWPLKINQSGEFPELGQAWRTVIEGRRGISMRELKKKLLERWASLLAAYAVQVFERYRQGFNPAVQTKNVAFQTFSGMSATNIRALEVAIRAAVMADPNCVEVSRIDKNRQTGAINPVKGFEYAMKYALARPYKNIEFRDLGGGMVTARAYRNGKFVHLGTFEVLVRKMMQFFSVYRFRRYQAYGLFHGGWGRAKQASFVRAMNQGYPR